MNKLDKYQKFEGFEWSIPLNQIGAMKAGLLGEVYIDEIIMFECFIKFTSWPECEKIILIDKRNGDKIFYHFPWYKIMERIPFFKVKSRSPIKARFKKLCDVKLLKPHPNNNKMAKAFYTFGELYPVYNNRKPVLNQGRPRPQQRTPPSSTKDATRPQRRTPPSSTKDATRPQRRTLMIVL